MIEHFILLALAFFAFLLAVDRNRFKIGTFISATLFWIVAYTLVTFRADSVGNDTHAYIEYFVTCLQFDNYSEFMDWGSGRFEIGFATFSYLISKITDNYTGFFAICNLLYFGATIYFFRASTTNKNVWILAWFLTGMYYNLFNTLRASMAVVFIYFLAADFLKEKKIRALVWYVLAASMHVSALATGIIFFLKSKYVSKILVHEFVLLIAFGIVGAFFAQFMSLLPNYYSDYYFESEYGQGSTRIASIVDFVILGVLYLLSYRTEIKDWINHDFFKIMFLFSIGMSFFGLFLPIFNRIEFFFKPFAIVYVLNTFRYKSQWKQILIIITFGVLAVYQVVAFIIRPDWLGIFPYYFK